MATARWVFPVPVPPTRTMLRLPSRKPPPASSWIRGSLTGEAAKSKSASAAGRWQPGGRHLVLDGAGLLVGDLGGNGGAKLVHGSGGIVSLRAEQNSAT